MAKTREELGAEIAALAAAVDADVEQTTKVIEAVNALIKKIEESGNTDFTAEVEALSAATVKLSSDNATVQEAIDKAVPPVPAPVPEPPVA